MKHCQVTTSILDVTQAAVVSYSKFDVSVSMRQNLHLEISIECEVKSELAL